MRTVVVCLASLAIVVVIVVVVACRALKMSASVGAARQTSRPSLQGSALSGS